MRAAKHNNRKGFTLIEAMMAMALLSIAAAGLIVPFSAGAAVQAEGWQRTLASKLCSDLLEQIIATDFDEIKTTWSTYSESKGQIKNSRGVVVTDTAYSRLSRDITIVDATLGSITNYWVTVKVYNNGDEMVKLSTLIGP